MFTGDDYSTFTSFLQPLAPPLSFAVMALLALELLLLALAHLLPQAAPRDVAPLLSAAVRALEEYLHTLGAPCSLRLAQGTRRLQLALYCSPREASPASVCALSVESIVAFLAAETPAENAVDCAFARARSRAERRLVDFLARSFASAPAAIARAPRPALDLARAVDTYGLATPYNDNDADAIENTEIGLDGVSADGLGSSEGGAPLVSNDTVLASLHRLFSPLARDSAWNVRCARAMVAVFSAARCVRLMELDSAGGHADAVGAFLVPLLPLSLHHTADALLRHLQDPPEPHLVTQSLRQETSLGQGIYSNPPKSLDRSFGRPRPLEPSLEPLLEHLASNLDAVVSILNEYDLDFDPLFPRCFRHYLFLVHHDLVPWASHTDHRYINHVASTVNAIIDFDGSPVNESSLVRSIVHDLHHMQFHLTLPQTLLMRLALKEVDNLHQVAKTAFSVWNSRLLDAAQLQVLCDESFIPTLDRRISKRYFSAWYNKRTRFSHLKAQAADYSDKRLAAKYFNSYWIEKLLAIARAESQSDAFRMRPVLRVWKSRYFSIRALDSQLRDYAEARALGAAFSTLRIKQKALDSLQLLARDFYAQSSAKSDTVLLRNSMALWTRKLALSSPSPPDLLSRKLSVLSGLGLAFTMRKYLRLWRGRSTLFEVAGQFEQKSRARFKNKFFSLWKLRLQSHDVSRSFVLQRDKRLISNAFRSWKFAVDDQRRASTFSKKSSLALTFKLWKLKARLNVSEGLHQRRLLKLTLNSWSLAVLAQHFQLKSQVNLEAKAFRSWADAHQDHTQNIAKAREVYDRNLIQHAISSWVSLLALNQELAVVANLNLQRKFLQTLASKCAKYKQCATLANQLLKNGKTFDDRLIIVFYLRNWKERYMERYEDISRKAASDFESKVRNKNTLHVFFKFWHQNLRQLIKRQQVLEQRLYSSSGFNEMGRIYFDHWSERVVSHRQAMERSADFYTTLLHKKYLLAWYEKYVAKVDYLLDISDDLRNQKDYICLLDNLRKWNLNLIKHVKRNNQTCTMFREKWEKANMKSLFQLWLHKTRQREFTLGDDEEEEFVEANTTFGSNLSPLSRKYPRSGSASMFDTASYLNTPVKKQVQGLFTPQNRKGPSPTRLQETNQRMKIDKMDALINHYKLAKKSSNTGSRLSKAVRLSPPKLTYSVSHLPVKPPAPRFETHSSSSSPEATSSPSSSVGEPEISLLNTAKKLKKIKPLVIPPQKESEFRLTSVSKLRARLQAREGSTMGPSNVFDDTN